MFTLAYVRHSGRSISLQIETLEEAQDNFSTAVELNSRYVALLEHRDGIWRTLTEYVRNREPQLISNIDY